MLRQTNRLRLCGYLALVWMMAFSAHAASIEATPHKGYGRINFAFAEPARLKASMTGSTALLNFDKPVSQSPEEIKASLPGYVRNVTLSPDKHSVTLTLSKPYRLRQFVSGNSVGIDLVGDPDEASPAATKDASKPVEPPPVAAEKPAPKPATKTEKKPIPTVKPAAKEAPKKKPATAEKPKEVATKPAPKAVEKPAHATSPEVHTPPTSIAAAAHTEDALLTTKHVAPAAPIAPAAKPTTPTAADAMLTTKAAPTQPSAAPPPAPTTAPAAQTPPPPATHVDAKEDDDTATAPAEKKPTAEPQAASVPPAATEVKPVESKPAPSKAKGPFLVTTKTANGETTLNFPWRDRTGAAVFRRDDDIWIVFSEARDMNVALLRTIMPKHVVNVMQYAYPGATVLRILTDGTMYARADQAKGNYGWDVTLSNKATAPSQDVTITTDSMEDTTRLLLGIFDVSTPVRFFDPTVGDMLIIVPSFENGRGVVNERNFPEFSLLASNLGLAIATPRADLSTKQSRSGFIIDGKAGLAVSKNLPMMPGIAPILGANLRSGVMIPYDQWYVPDDQVRDTETSRLHEIASATKAGKPDAMLELVKLYLVQGRGMEASGVISIIGSDFPQYYATNKLALLSAASHIMQYRPEEAAKDLEAPELAEVDEAMLWREVVALYAPPPTTAQNAQNAIEAAEHPNDSVANTPTPPAPAAAPGATPAPAPAPVPVAAAKPVFHFLKYNKTYIHLYPPRIRQRLATIAADSYLEDGQEEKALATFDTLMHDDILGPVKGDAEFTLGTVAAKKGQVDEAHKAFARLMKQTDDRRLAIRARYADAMLSYQKGKLSGEETAEILENARVGWRGDALERSILNSLIDIYTDAKRYDALLRTYKAILDGFSNDPEMLAISGQMGDLFERIFLDGLADEMEPLKALSLFYEFRELTPVGDKGDKIVQKLADRLAAIDLLDRATQLLENQVKFRSTGEARSQIGARLALLHLLNHQPQEALTVLEVTNFGDNKPELQVQRQELTAEALSKVGKNEEALGVISNDTSKPGAMLRLDILWAMQDWPNVVNHAEDILGARPNLTQPLTTEETAVLLKLALGYAFEGDYIQLRYLRDYYSNLIPDTAYKKIFDFITNDTTPLDPEDFAMLAKQISHTESFLDTFKSKIAAGKLSEAIQ